MPEESRLNETVAAGHVLSRIREMLREKGFKNIELQKDISGADRMLSALKEL